MACFVILYGQMCYSHTYALAGGIGAKSQFSSFAFTTEVNDWTNNRTAETVKHPILWALHRHTSIHSVFVVCDTVTNMCRFEWCCSVNYQISGIDVEGIILPKHLHAIIIWLDLAVNWLLIVQHQMQCIVSQSFHSAVSHASPTISPFHSILSP